MPALAEPHPSTEQLNPFHAIAEHKRVIISTPVSLGCRKKEVQPPGSACFKKRAPNSGTRRIEKKQKKVSAHPCKGSKTGSSEGRRKACRDPYSLGQVDRSRPIEASLAGDQGKSLLGCSSSTRFPLLSIPSNQ